MSADPEELLGAVTEQLKRELKFLGYFVESGLKKAVYFGEIASIHSLRH